MIEVKTNISEILGKELARIKALRENQDAILRTVALTVLPELKTRVHRDGKDSAGNQIGTYSPAYMKVRTGNYRNSSKVTRGENKGKLKDAGKYSRGAKEGTARQKYNRTGDTTVILSLTRQMENDTSVIQTANGYGIGYLNHFNYQKALWCEATYKKPILTELTAGEVELAAKTARDFTTDYLKTI